MLTSSVLIFDKRISTKNEMGADVLANIGEALKKVQTSHYSSIVIDLRLATQDEIGLFIETAQKQNPNGQIILLDDPALNTQIHSFINRFSIFKILPQFDEQKIYRTIQESLEEYNLKKQNRELFQILSEQNTKLQHLTLDLETRVTLRQKSLLDSKEKLIQVSKYHSSMLSALVAIQKAESIPDMEKVLVKCLSDSLQIKWVRILFQTQNSLAQDAKKQLQQFAIYEGKLVLEKRSLGKIIFARNSNSTLPVEQRQKFSKEEIQFLKQISDAISLALDRLIQRERSDFVREQWQSTFDAIVEPVAIINSDYELLQFNHAFGNQSSQDPKQKHCYQQLFGRSGPCEGCQLGRKFSLALANTSKGKEVLFEVESQNLKGQKNIFVHFYRDKLQQVRAERQILESSKMAELGLVGGSIAHELNNPLAGLITFIQILKQDIEKEKTSGKPSQLLNDLSEMEKSALKCKEIIQNLLSFTRKSKDKKEKLHLSDVINKSLRMMQLQSKPSGIEIEFKNHLAEDRIEALENPLVQSLVNILQNAYDSVTEKKKTEKNFSPLIEVELSQDERHFFIDVFDNGIGLGKNEQLKAFTPFFTTKNSDLHRGLGLTISYQIIKEHFGDLELTSVFGNRTRARVIFPRPVL